MIVLAVMTERWLPFGSLNRRRADRRGPAYRVGSRVEVLGPFDVRTGPGTVTRVTRGGQLFVDLDAGKDVLVERRYVRALPPVTLAATCPTCEGEGEIIGLGGTYMCEHCDGSGVVPS